MEKQITFEESEALLLVDSHLGIYSGQQLGEILKGVKSHNADTETVETLCNGPDDEFYIEACNDIDGFEFTGQDDVKYIVYWNEDIWAIPADKYELINWDEMP